MGATKFLRLKFFHEALCNTLNISTLNKYNFANFS